MTTTLHLLTADGVTAKEPLGLFSTRDHAELARRRLHCSNDGWHELAITELAVDEWHEPEWIGDVLRTNWHLVDPTKPLYGDPYRLWTEPPLGRSIATGQPVRWLPKHDVHLPAPTANERPWIA